MEWSIAREKARVGWSRSLGRGGQGGKQLERETLQGSLPPLPLSYPGCPQLLHAAGWIRTHGQASPSSETDGPGPRLPSPKPWRLEGIHASWWSRKSRCGIRMVTCLDQIPRMLSGTCLCAPVESSSHLFPSVVRLRPPASWELLVQSAKLPCFR